MGDVHGYDAESSLGFRSFFQFGHDEIQTPATLGVSVSAFDGIALTGITVELSLNLLIRGIGLPSPKLRAGEADVVSLAESASSDSHAVRTVCSPSLSSCVFDAPILPLFVPFVEQLSRSLLP